MHDSTTFPQQCDQNRGDSDKKRRLHAALWRAGLVVTRSTLARPDGTVYAHPLVIQPRGRARRCDL